MTKMMMVGVSLIGMAGVALAGDPKTGAPAAGQMEMPKPPAELAQHAKDAAGTWKCTGTTTGMDGKTQMKMNGTMTSKLDLDGWFMHDTFTGTIPDMKNAKFKMESYATYDAASKKWRGFSVMNDGGMMQSQGDMTNGKMEMTADTWGPMGTGMFKDHMDATDMKKGVHMSGEMSMDKGKTWMPVYDMTCKK